MMQAAETGITMKRNDFVKIGMGICTIAAVVGLMVLSTKIYRIQEPKSGQNYEMVSRCRDGSMGRNLRREQAQNDEVVSEAENAEDVKTSAEWIAFKEGCGLWHDEEGSYCLRQDVGEEKDILVWIKPVKNLSDESRAYTIEVYWEKEEKPFQSIPADNVQITNVSSYLYNTYYVDKLPFSFQDFNVDGYLDISFVEASSPKVFSHYIWSPTRQRFVRGPKELEECLHYYIYDENNRRFEVTKEGMNTDSVYYYQWSGETDCECIKTFYAEREEKGNEVVVRIRDHRDGEDRIIMDYRYNLENYPYEINKYWIVYSFFTVFCQDNFLWQETVRDRASGKNYTLYYAQEFKTNYMGDATGEIEGHVWALDEDTKLVKKLFWMEPAACEKAGWEEGQALVIRYCDGSEKKWTLSEILKDPAEEIYKRGMQIDYTVKEFPIDTEKYDAQTDKQYKDAYYKALSSQTPVRDSESEIYLKKYFRDADMEDEKYLEDIIDSTRFYYMDFDGDGMPELIMNVAYGDGLHILKYLPDEDVVEFFFAAYRMPYYDLMGAGQLYYDHGTIANKWQQAYDVVDKDGQTKRAAYFLEEYDYLYHEDDSWKGTYWVDLNDELGMVQVDEMRYYELISRFTDALKDAPAEMSFEEIFGDAH
ncbi:MAG: hypothetical protein NC126_10635 [Clostridium sp.]|nr:hypothetical protein [Clostridium sp.]